MDKLYFSSDYMEGCHPNILNRLVKTNMESTVGYGHDKYTEIAKSKILKACDMADGEVAFLVGGTQTNATIIDCVLKTFEGVLAANTGHIAVHESGAIEHTGHKVITIPHVDGKITAKQVSKYLKDFYDDDNWKHMVAPGMVYISNPTEYGTLYSLQELKDLSSICKEYNIPLYLDGARLAYALAVENYDVTLKELAKYCDLFYIGGTKCGALFGEAVVMKKGFIPHFETLIKQHGALLAKGRINALQFDELFSNNLYLNIGKNAIKYANIIRKALLEKGYKLVFENPTNQVFTVLDNKKIKDFGKLVEFGFWEKYDENSTVIRLATSWATNEDSVNKLVEIL